MTKALKLPHIRRAMSEVIPTAKAQHWDPAEIVRVLLAEEAAAESPPTCAPGVSELGRGPLTSPPQTLPLPGRGRLPRRSVLTLGGVSLVRARRARSLIRRHRRRSHPALLRPRQPYTVVPSAQGVIRSAILEARSIMARGYKARRYGHSLRKLRMPCDFRRVRFSGTAWHG
ncbi:hypothetical protein ACFQX6_10490 [Streptosporangium lutulentum]